VHRDGEVSGRAGREGRVQRCGVEGMRETFFLLFFLISHRRFLLSLPKLAFSYSLFLFIVFSDDTSSQFPTLFQNHQRMFVPEGPLRKPPADEPLITNVLYQKIQNFIGPESFVVAETGDSWFNCLKLKLPEGCGYEFQMQYGSIGWSVGATLGAAAAAAGSAAPEALAGTPRRRVLASIGDGSFQMTVQDVSTMMRYRLNPIIILVNNAVRWSFFIFFIVPSFFFSFVVVDRVSFSFFHFFFHILTSSSFSPSFFPVFSGIHHRG